MQVLSVNGGKSQPFTVQGDKIKTGFYKKAQKGPVRVVKTGIEGDSMVTCAGNLNRAVLFYQAHYYDYWRAELKRDLPFGMMGENITFEGPNDGEFFIGDVLRIGSTLMRISEPRHPCIKIGVRFEDDTFPLRYLKSGRSGFFCCVLEEGKLSAGDEIELVHREDNALPLPEFTRVIFLEPRDVAGIERMLDAPTLSPEWRIRAQRVLDRAVGSKDGWQEYRSLSVVRRWPESKDVISFDLEDPKGEKLPRFDAGQFLTVQLDVPGEERPVVRTFTINGRSDSDRGYRISVLREVSKLLEDGTKIGVGTNYLHDLVHEGDSIRALPPRGNFITEPESRPVVLLSAGIGVTPMMAMLGQLASDQMGREVFFIHGARSGQEHVLDERVRKLTTGSDRLHRYVKYSRPTPDDIEGRDFDKAGHVTIEDVEMLIPSLEAEFYVCGLTSFMQDIIRGLVDRGVEKTRIHYEFFGASVPLFGEQFEDEDGEPVTDANGKPIVVTFARSAVTVPWRQNVASLLILAEHNGLQPPQSCRSGICEVCICRLDAGEVSYDCEIINPPKKGEVMVCCAQPLTSVMVDL